MIKEAPAIRVVKQNPGGSSAPVGRMSEERIDFHLWNWACWHRTSGVQNLGYTVSRGVSGSSDVATMERACDRKSAMDTNAAINDLPPTQSGAVYCKHLYCVFRFPREDPEALYIQARDTLAVSLVRKHLF